VKGQLTLFNIHKRINF